MEWNQRTGNYESADGQIVVSGDLVAEARNDAAREQFGVNADDLTDEQYAAIDAAVLDASGWDWDEYRK